MYVHECIYSSDLNDFSSAQNITQFSSGPPGSTRRGCFTVNINTDDVMFEELQSFTIDLRLDNETLFQSGIEVQPNVTEIFIVDGMYIHYVHAHAEKNNTYF